MLDDLPPVADPGDIFKAKARQALDDPGAPVAFTPIEIIQVAWIIAQALVMLWKCVKGDPAKALERAMSPGPIDKVRLYFLVRRSGYPRGARELADRLKGVAYWTEAREVQQMWEAMQ